MRTLRKFVHLPNAQKVILLRALWLAVLATAAVRLVPFRLANRLLRRTEIAARGDVSEASICWAIGAAARRIPGCNCLPQALAGARLLRLHGIAAEIVIGVAPAADGLKAHAWVVDQERVLLGGALSEQRYTVLTREVLNV